MEDIEIDTLRRRARHVLDTVQATHRKDTVRATHRKDTVRATHRKDFVRNHPCQLYIYQSR